MQGRERLRRDASGTASNDDDEGHDFGLTGKISVELVNPDRFLDLRDGEQRAISAPEVEKISRK
jgi:hypothetical protein